MTARSACPVVVVLTLLAATTAAAQDWRAIFSKGVQAGEQQMSAEERRLIDKQRPTADDIDRMLVAAFEHWKRGTFKAADRLFDTAKLALHDALGAAAEQSEKAALAQYFSTKVEEADYAGDPQYARAARIIGLQRHKFAWDSLDAVDASITWGLSIDYQVALNMPLPAPYRADAFSRCEALRQRARELLRRAPEVRNWKFYGPHGDGSEPCRKEG